MADSGLPTKSTSSSDPTYQSQSSISTPIPNLTVKESTLKKAIVPEHLVEVHYVLGVADSGAHEATIGEKVSVYIGPYHSALEPLPLNATIVRKIESTYLETLLSNYKILAFDYLIPPTTIEMPEILDHVTKWEERYPHILHNICFPARVEWQRRLKELDNSIDWEKVNYREWRKSSISNEILSHNSIDVWEETAMYLRIDESIHKSYLLWCKYSQHCILSMEHERMLKQQLDEYNFRKKVFGLLGISSDPLKLLRRPKVYDLHFKKEKYNIDVVRVEKYYTRPDYLDYPVPDKSLSNYLISIRAATTSIAYKIEAPLHGIKSENITASNEGSSSLTSSEVKEDSERRLDKNEVEITLAGVETLLDGKEEIEEFEVVDSRLRSRKGYILVPETS